MDIVKALQSLRPNAEWVVQDGVLEWMDDKQTQPTDAEIKTEIARLQAEYDSNKYQRDRKAKYPDISDQLDMQYWDAVNGTTLWQDHIAKIKSDIPKE